MVRCFFKVSYCWCFRNLSTAQTFSGVTQCCCGTVRTFAPLQAQQTSENFLITATWNFVWAWITAAFFSLFILWFEAIRSQGKFLRRCHIESFRQRSDITLIRKKNIAACRSFFVKNERFAFESYNEILIQNHLNC